MKIVILGAGPTGLGAAYRLQELGHDDWELYEAEGHVGGLASSVTTPTGFVYDIGGHVMFSSYRYFHALVDKLLGDQFTSIQRESWIWMNERWVPYPFQNNLRYLDADDTIDCLLGLAAPRQDPAEATNFHEWTLAVFGEGIASRFMFPYNFKVWAHPAEVMSKEWIADRVSVVDLEGSLRSVLNATTDKAWGPNNAFKFPLRGGTGGLYEAFVPHVKRNLRLNQRAVAIDSGRKVVTFEDGHDTTYDVLLTTLPLTGLVSILVDAPSTLQTAASTLSWNSGLFVGLGIARELEDEKCWVYFPEESCPFYRLTYLSRYSPYMAPEGHFSIVTETSTSPYKPVDKDTIVDETIQGLLRTGILRADDLELIADRTLIEVPKAYPIPTVHRDAALAVLQPWLASHDMYSRGRFGAWKYEIGNMDHSVMQGVEFANRVLLGESETVWTGPQPALATA